jgi:hypothetical protein
MGMRRGSWICLGLVALAPGCSSVAFPEGTGGSGAGGSPSGVGGAISGSVGMIAGTGGTPVIIGGTGVGGAPEFQGSCGTPHVNPDSAPGGACVTDCQTFPCGRACTEDCCLPCGIDFSGSKVCVCPVPGLPYTSCSCTPPATIPPGLLGGPCNPQGFSTSIVPLGAPSTTPSLHGMPCKVTSPLTVCFTLDSTASAERGCICESDGVMHCGSVNHWFANNGVPTSWMP